MLLSKKIRGQKGNTALILIVLVLVAIGGFLLIQKLQQRSGTSQKPPSTTTNEIKAVNLEEGKRLPPAQIKITKDSFTPQTLIVKAGQSVTWINYDAASHQLISDAKNPADSLSETDPIAASERMTFSFSSPATIHITDSQNSTLKGIIIVK